MQHIPLEIICLGIYLTAVGRPGPHGKSVYGQRISCSTRYSRRWAGTRK
jgi:hypothetical protein